MINLLLPIETANREFDFTVFLSSMLAQRGFRVLLGLHDSLLQLLDCVQGGVFLGKSVIQPFATHDLTTYQRLVDQRFVIAHLDTEGAVYAGDEAQWRATLSSRIDPRVFRESDHVFTWGTYQRDFYQEPEPACSHNICATGHPRFDLYKAPYRQFYAREAEAIRARWGRYVLVNTNFGYGNHKLGPSAAFSPENGYRSDSAENRRTVSRIWAHQTHAIAHFVEAIHEAATALDIHFIIRPHPSEDWDFWRAVFRGVDNVAVVHEGPVAPWLLACAAMVHDGCTTGIEAFLAEVPIVNFQASVSTQRTYLPNVFGTRCESVAGFVQAVSAALDGERGSTEIEPRAAALLKNLEQTTFDTMLTRLDQIGEQVTSSEVDIRHLRKRAAICGALDMTKNVLRPHVPNRRKAHEYFRNKFPGFRKLPVDDAFARVEHILGTGCSVSMLNDSVLMVEGR